MSVIGIVGHFRTERGSRLNLVLALKKMQGSHTGAALAEIVVKVVDKYVEISWNKIRVPRLIQLL